MITTVTVAKNSRRRRAAFLLLTFASIVQVCAGCSDPPEANPLSIVEDMVGGPGTLGLSAEGVTVTGLVVFFHGMDEDRNETTRDAKHRALTETMLSAGYAVVSADAGGNSFGNPEAQLAYRRLLTDAIASYGTDRVFFVAESMGALPAVLLYEDSARGTVRGMVGISPMMGIPPDYRSIAYIAQAWGGNVPDDADSLSWPLDRMAGKKFQLLASRDDTVIPADAGSDAFSARFAEVATIDVVRCKGDHVDTSCFDSSEILRWMNAIP